MSFLVVLGRVAVGVACHVAIDMQGLSCAYAPAVAIIC